jgi:hypothetical protein
MIDILLGNYGSPEKGFWGDVESCGVVDVGDNHTPVA